MFIYISTHENVINIKMKNYNSHTVYFSNKKYVFMKEKEL